MPKPVETEVLVLSEALRHFKAFPYDQHKVAVAVLEKLPEEQRAAVANAFYEVLYG